MADEIKIEALTKTAIQAAASRSGIGEPTIYWHEYNPWKDILIYVPINELAECAMVIGAAYTDENGQHQEYTAQTALNQWRKTGEKLDAYVLPSVTPTGGIRYGMEGSEYLSPGFYPEKIQALIDKYS
jgi:hypothetical protein